MSKKPGRKPAAPASPAPIEPLTLYRPVQLAALLRLPPRTLTDAIQRRELRACRVARRNHVLGEWALEWLRGRELPRKGA